MQEALGQFLFVFQRLNWLSVLDLLLVTAIFFAIMMLVKDTQAMVLLRGVILVAIALSLLVSLVNLPAFSFLIRNTLPALVVTIPVIFAPEIRRALERLGRAGSGQEIFRRLTTSPEVMEETIRGVVSAAARLSARQHGALIVLQRNDSLREYVRTGVRLDATVTPELLMQIFYPNTPLHDGAVIISGRDIVAAACVMPLSSSGILTVTPDRQMGLRHRAALGIAEASDAIAMVVSEETGSISIAHNGRMIRRLDPERLENILNAFYKAPTAESEQDNILRRLLNLVRRPREDGDKE
ncbi:MAG: TIGR00159 family protein [Anaerolineae bacterium]|nr:TIGR00159 family protein [Anaerolineae bacterium]